MITCPSCNQSHEEAKDVWLCLLCAKPICEHCYVEHTKRYTRDAVWQAWQKKHQRPVDRKGKKP